MKSKPIDCQLIAEVKTRSPFGYKSSKSWDELFYVASHYGDIISVHTDIRWGGSLQLIRKARQLTNKPILAKGIHTKDSEIIKALDCGANIVLVVGRIPKKHINKCLIEPNSINELLTLPINTKAVWNQRDLRTGKPKKETYSQARQAWSGWLCQASLVETVNDIQPGADAILVGTHLEKFVASLKSNCKDTD